MKPLTDFARQLSVSITFQPDLLFVKKNRYFLAKKDLQNFLQRDVYYAGTYLGKIKKEKFFPSLSFLSILSRKKANKIIVGKKTAWLFVCGRDVFRKGVKSFCGSHKQGDYTLVLNEYEECLGFGRILRNLTDKSARLAVKNILDLGDYLRRET
ncbi:hypothetical protein KAI12_02490 [Candidatus Bathyarchaeota archaeon]|nr:hypothetical protein [Candidatus Bathyarchaeota archaeon]